MLAKVLRGAVALFAVLFCVAALPAQREPISILVYSQTQCQDCARMLEVLRIIQAKYPGKVRVETRNLGASDPGFRPELGYEAKALGISTLPTLFVLGRRIAGYVDEAALGRVLDTALGKVLAEDAVELRVAAFPTAGPDAAPEIVVFSDFQCPHCSVLAPKLKELARGGEAKIRFVHYPLDFHTKAPAAHRAAIAASLQGKFWEMHDRIFSSKTDISRETLERFAQELELEASRFVKDMESDEAAAAVAEGIAEGDRVGISGTPAVYVNGRPLLVAPTLENLRKALAAASGAEPSSAQPEPAVLTLQGNPEAPVTLEWFFDAHSPTTAASWQTVQAVLAEQGQNLQLVARHLPMNFHRTAKTSHQALEFAAKDGKFAEFLQLLNADPREPDTDRLFSIAMRLGLDVAALSRQLADVTFAASLERDARRAAVLGIKGVPTFVLNGKRVEGVPDAATLLARLEQETTHSKASLSTHGGGAQEK
jgi:protein-disulfide isomerase